MMLAPGSVGAVLVALAATRERQAMRAPNCERDAMRPDADAGREYAEIRGEAVDANPWLRFRSTGRTDRTFAGDRSGAATATAGKADARLEVEEIMLGVHRGLAAGKAGQ